MKKHSILAWSLCIFIVLAFEVSGETRTAVTSVIDWEKMEIRAALSLDMVAAKLRLPSGRVEGEEILRDESPRLLRPPLLSLPVDSSGVLGDLVSRGEFPLTRLDGIITAARKIPPALSPDLAFLSSSYTMDLTQVSTALVRHRQAAELPRILLPVSAAAYTGIIIMAYEELPVHGRNISAFPAPCLFPRIWDTDMNLIHERNIMDPEYARKQPLVRYVSPDKVFQTTPSGIDPSLHELVGDHPLRILARGVFGIRPTDLIIDRADALLIFSSEVNKQLLREGRVVIALKAGTLVTEF